ncbi:MAG TPA: A/G-specific adenine glycosylase [Flavisolibacter sp.]|nr:A/G-specific adenine glycosylase [Flavisolibacter sp.]
MQRAEADEKIKRRFAEELLHWNKKSNDRQMPWKGEKDPYKIWLSEIILQQTRVEQGLKYYENFIKSFPDVHTLAKAPQEKIFKHWEGLGYYSRCRNLIEAASFISKELKGRFPSSYESILELKGVGSYTASAIASFAYNLPYAVLDGNVFRVLARILDIETPIDSTEGKKQFAQIAQSILPGAKAGEYNQAIMDFGAVICKPVPQCSSCFFNQYCKAYLAGKQQLLPIKEKKTRIKQRWLNYIVVRSKNEVAVRQRTGKDIWQQLFEFVLIETDKPFTQKQLLKQFEKQFGITSYTLISGFEPTLQKLSHQSICFNFIVLKTAKKEKIGDFTWKPLSHLDQLAFPKTLKEFIEQHLK